ncbi:MAG: phenylalanine--tRNA ligase subunit alpha [Armatimonadota bacterium]
MIEFNTITDLVKESSGRIETAKATKELDEIEVEYLGRKGRLTQLLRTVGELPAEQRPLFGSCVNEAKSELEAVISERRTRLASEETERRIQAESIDVTLPGRLYKTGKPHILVETMARIKSIFIGMGYEVVESPEIESYHYNFEALNYPEEHPAMDEQMSFYVTDRDTHDVRSTYLLRTQTTASHKRVYEKRKPPFRICTMGKCYRYEAVDATHGHTFHQVDCFTVGKNITFADLKGTLDHFCREMFGPDAKTRFRPDFFPFVEPGAEIAVSIGGGRWLELGGAGMIHPNELANSGMDPKIYSGFAFGLGIDRMPMIEHQIDDLRLFMEDDLRFLAQF